VVRGNESRVFDSRTREIASCKKGDFGYEYLTVGSSWTEEKDKEGHIMKIIEGLQREAQAHRADSLKLMKVRDRQGAFNLKFLKSLERIEKKLEKGRDSSTTESCRTHGRRSRSRSGS
jgi:hypothetical protein